MVQEHGSGTLDYFALRDDKDWFFTGSSVVAHSVRGGVCLVSPDPIGPPEERGLAWAEFLDFADDFGWSVAVIGAAADWLPDYESSGLRTVYLGDEAIVDCPTFSLEGRSHKSLAAGGQPHPARRLHDDLPRPVGHRARAARADRGDERGVPARRDGTRLLDDAVAAVPARGHRSPALGHARSRGTRRRVLPVGPRDRDRRLVARRHAAAHRHRRAAQRAHRRQHRRDDRPPRRHRAARARAELRDDARGPRGRPRRRAHGSSR